MDVTSLGYLSTLQLALVVEDAYYNSFEPILYVIDIAWIKINDMVEVAPPFSFFPNEQKISMHSLHFQSLILILQYSVQDTGSNKETGNIVDSVCFWN